MSIINKILLGLGAAVAIYIGWLLLANAHLKTQLAEERAVLATCRAANTDFAAAVAVQNQAVAGFSADSERRATEARTKADAAQKSIRAYMKAADKLSKKRRGDTEICRAANDLINDYLKDMK